MMNKSKSNSKLPKAWKLIIFGLIGGVFGYALSSGSFVIPQSIDFSLSLMYEYDILFAFLMLLVLVLLITNITGLFRLNAMKEPSQSSDLPITPKEKVFNATMKFSNYNIIVSFITMVLAMAYAMRSVSVDRENTYMLVNLIASLVLFIVAAILQNRTLAMFNRMYPHRKINFNASTSMETERELFAEMDEGEQWIVYRSAYSAYKTANAMLIGGIVFFLIYSVAFGFTPLPIIVLGLVWLGQNMAYHREVNKQYQ